MNTTWIFDCDGTLYDHQAISSRIYVRIRTCVESKLGVSSADADKFILRAKEKHQTHLSVLALRAELGMDTTELVKETYLKASLDGCAIRDGALSALLKEITDRKVVFTSSPSQFTTRILQQIGLDHHFDQIIGMSETGYIVKPQLESYLRASSLLGDPANVIFCDDHLENVSVASSIGWQSFLFDPEGLQDVTVDTCTVIRSFSELLTITSK